MAIFVRKDGFCESFYLSYSFSTILLTNTVDSMMVFDMKLAQMQHSSIFHIRGRQTHSRET